MKDGVSCEVAVSCRWGRCNGGIAEVFVHDGLVGMRWGRWC
jgi:hypothetical protein